MCGIAGIWDPKGSSESSLSAMTGALRHRGPDASGYWVDGRHGLSLGHRRLSILDLSESGRQPMFSADGRFAIVYNGEIYNFSTLRADVEEATGGSYPFVGGSDTEVLLSSVATFGLRRTLDRAVGMFAFALWDRHRAKLVLVRDRLGIKPLYYGFAEGALIFASELSALQAHPGCPSRVDRASLAAYLRHSAVSAPRTIYEGIYKLLPAEVISFSGPGRQGMERSQFWRADEAMSRGIGAPYRGGVDRAIDELQVLLSEAVACRMIADVPLGALLSGGVDSSMVVALMQEHSRRPVKTFSIGFESDRYDEGDDAAAVARALGTDHTGLVLTAAEALEIIERLPELFDEPFADSSQIPTYLVSELARREVTVALSGDGGDEVFGGYNRHRMARPLSWWLTLMPRGARQVIGAALQSAPPQAYDGIAQALGGLPGGTPPRLVGDKIHKLAKCLGARSTDELYARLTSEWPDPAVLLPGVRERPRALVPGPRHRHLAREWMYRDLVGYLPDDILTKVDRASMAVSLEARVPLLDHRVVEWAFALPTSMLIRGGQGKWLLRQLLYRYVPRELVDRPKMGFGIPLDEWLRGPLRPWAEALLGEERLRREGFFDPRAIGQAWEHHLSGRRNLAYPLWNVLVFQSWWASRSQWRGERRRQALR